MPAGAETKIELMSERDMGRALMRMAHEIIEGNAHEARLLIVGIRRRGVPLARRLAERIGSFAGVTPPVGELDITLYRDDLVQLDEQPKLKGSEMPAEVTGAHLVLVDDVIYTGRTARAAIDAIIDLGRPECIRLVELVDRGHRELPIRADYVGKNVPTNKQERISVCVKEIDGEDAVYLVKESS